jgi:type II secretory pathway pseudopilin PulG
MSARVPSARRAGFTISELVISMTILGFMLAGSTITLLTVQRQYTAQRATAEARETARSLEIVFGRLFRNARANPQNLASTSVAVVVNHPNGSTNWNNIEVRSDFNPADGLLTGNMENVAIQLTRDTVYITWRKNGPKEAVAYPVSSLRFQFFAIDSTEITAPALAGAQGRRVKVTVGVPVPKTSEILQRESWFTLRN